MISKVKNGEFLFEDQLRYCILVLIIVSSLEEFAATKGYYWDVTDVKYSTIRERLLLNELNGGSLHQ